MKWTLIIVALCMYSLHANSDLDTVKQLLTDLKTNVQLDIEALDAAWELHKKNKQSVIDALGFSASEQRSECAKKDEDVQSKQRDIKITNDFVAWMQKRQGLNSQRLGVLEVNRCQASNNYVHDIKNYKIALALVRFLREQLDKFDSNATAAQKQEFLQRVHKFVQIYQTGKLLTMVDRLEMKDDGSYVLPDIEGEEQDLTESVLSQTRGKRNANKILLQQQQQTTVIASGDGDDKADSAVVLIPGQCDDSINTVVVVQNDDGTGGDDDLHIRFTNGGSSGGQGGSSKPKPKPQPKPQPQEEDDDDTEEEQDDGQEEEQGDLSEEEGDQSEEENQHQDDDTPEEQHDNEEEGSGEEEDQQQHHEPTHPSGEEDSDDNDNGEDNGEDDGDDNDGGSTPTNKINGGGQQQTDEEEEDLSDIRKLLDAIEKHSKKSLDLEQEDEVRSSMIYIDFKLHIELENQYFDKQISGEKENLIKLTNQLTSRVGIARQCNARLKQITIAYQVSQDDYNDSYQHYLELRKQKEEELATFEDIYRIYTTQVV